MEMKKKSSATWCFVFALISACRGEHLDELVDQFRHFESFVELKGGKFSMGVNDRHGINGEFPLKVAVVQPFRSAQKEVSARLSTPLSLSPCAGVRAQDLPVSGDGGGLPSLHAGQDSLPDPSGNERIQLSVRQSDEAK